MGIFFKGKRIKAMLNDKEIDFKTLFMGEGALPDSGDTPEQPEKLTDLTGTTWVFNDTVTAPKGYGRFGVTANLNGTTTKVTSLEIGYNYNPSKAALQENEKYGAFNAYYKFIYNSVPQYESIEFTGGEDVTNTALIDWLYENATLQSEETGGDVSAVPKLTIRFGNGMEKTVPVCLYDTDEGEFLIDRVIGNVSNLALEYGHLYRIDGTRDGSAVGSNYKYATATFTKGTTIGGSALSTNLSEPTVINGESVDLYAGTSSYSGNKVYYYFVVEPPTV